jgi:mRNA interferase HigB
MRLLARLIPLPLDHLRDTTKHPSPPGFPRRVFVVLGLLFQRHFSQITKFLLPFAICESIILSDAIILSVSGNCPMRIISLGKLREFWKHHADAESALRSWYTITEDADWDIPNDVRGTFRSADPVGDEFVVFDICRNDYRLVVRIDYRRSIVYIWDVLSHRDYDRLDLRAIDDKIKKERNRSRE